MTVIPFPEKKKKSEENDFSGRFMRRIMEVAKEHAEDGLDLARSVCTIVEDLVKSADRIRKTMFIADVDPILITSDPEQNQRFADLADLFPCLDEFPDLTAQKAVELLQEGFRLTADNKLAIHFLFYMFGVIHRFDLREARRIWKSEDWDAFIVICQTFPQPS